MEPKLKRRKICEEQQDRLGCLPDCILTHILSFLDTKTVIRTSVLSKRYKLLWTLSQCLDFELGKASLSRLGKSTVLSFMAYVYRVLLLRDHSDLFSFRLSFRISDPIGFVENCICYAAKHKVKHLELHACITQWPLELPKALIASSSLSSISLNGSIRESTIALPKSFALPNLKKLHLREMEFCETNSSGEIFTGCPSLETLVLTQCWNKPGNQLKSLDVRSPSLVTLKIKYWGHPRRAVEEHTINVNAPKIAFFILQDYIARVYLVKSLPCLSEDRYLVSHLNPFRALKGIGRKKQAAESCFSLIRQLPELKSLYLSRDTVEITSSALREHLKNIKFTKKYGTLAVDKIKGILKLSFAMIDHANICWFCY